MSGQLNSMKNSYSTKFEERPIVGKGGHTAPFLDQPPPFLRFPPFLEIQDVPTFHRSIRKTKELNNSSNQFVYNFYPRVS